MITITMEVVHSGVILTCFENTLKSRSAMDGDTAFQLAKILLEAGEKARRWSDRKRESKLSQAMSQIRRGLRTGVAKARRLWVGYGYEVESIKKTSRKALLVNSHLPIELGVEVNKSRVLMHVGAERLSMDASEAAQLAEILFKGAQRAHYNEQNRKSPPWSSPSWSLGASYDWSRYR